MKHFFGPAYYQEGMLAPYTYLGTDEQKALNAFCELDNACPCACYMFDEGTKLLYVFDAKRVRTGFCHQRLFPIS